jgi:hypothetical protein
VDAGFLNGKAALLLAAIKVNSLYVKYRFLGVFYILHLEHGKSWRSKLPVGVIFNTCHMKL